MTRNSSISKRKTKIELKKLKSILPKLKQKPTTTPIEIVLETIRYIRQLEDQLFDRYSGKIRKKNNNSTHKISVFLQMSTRSLEPHYPICQRTHHYYRIFRIQTDQFTSKFDRIYLFSI